MAKYAIGLDYGTESGRAVLVDLDTGHILATEVFVYTNGVIDETLPGSDVDLPRDWALQDPQDWIAVLEQTIPAVLEASGVDAGDIVGVGIDFTACTILPTLEDGTPLSSLAEHREQPHAWAKLWKHHSAQPEADRVTETAAERNEPWLARYGNKISSEWLLPKALEILEDAPDLYHKAATIIEGADWVVWQLTGVLQRNTCGAGYKGTWHKQEGYPSPDYLAALHPGLANLYTEKVAGPVKAPGEAVGTLLPAWAEKLGLSPETVIAAPIIDAHAASIGGGAVTPGEMLMIMGTSTCHLIISDEEVHVEGISGVVEDGIVPGFYAYEAGQAGVGDIFAWFVRSGVPEDYAVEAREKGVSLHDLLSEKAAALKPGETGLLALDWWNGSRTPLVDASLRGLMVGYSLSTKPEDIYRALIEATAYGTRLIIELFTAGDIEITRLVAGGGLTKNAMLMQIYADVIGLPIEVAASEQTSGVGAAILGAVAGGGHASIADAVDRMVPAPAQVIQPIDEHHETYSKLYTHYKHLVDLFGRESTLMKELQH